MTPYFDDGNGRVIYHGDCREVLPTIDRCDMVFTDPPYGHRNNDGDLIANWEAALGRGNAGPPRPIANDGAEANDLVRWLFAESARLLPIGCCCCCCCCGGGGPDPQFARWSLWMDELIGFKKMVVWDKGPMGMGWHYRRSYETVLVGERPGEKCRWFDTTNKVENVIRHIPKIIPSASQHPTEKPVALSQWFIRLHSQGNDLVVDPFAGTGSTLVAAKLEGRRAIGIELEERYCEIAANRLAQEVFEWGEATCP